MADTNGTIRNLLREIDEEERAIDAARASRSAAQADLGKYSRRIEEVRAVKRSLSGKMNDYATDVLSDQRSARDALAEATSGYSHEGRATGSIGEDKEQATESDFFGSQVHAALQAEIDACRRAIDAANAAIASADAQENSAQTRRSSYVNSARYLSQEDDATIHVSARTRY